MKHIPLDIYEDMPPSMQSYINNYGWHFNKKAYDCATSQMRQTTPDGKPIEVKPFTKEQVDELLMRFRVKPENGEMYDAAYVATMCKADFLKTSIIDEQHLAMYVKDVLDDPDGSDELPFRSWVQKCVALGKPVEWEDLL